MTDVSICPACAGEFSSETGFAAVTCPSCSAHLERGQAPGEWTLGTAPAPPVIAKIDWTVGGWTDWKPFLKIGLVVLGVILFLIVAVEANNKQQKIRRDTPRQAPGLRTWREGDPEFDAAVQLGARVTTRMVPDGRGGFVIEKTATARVTD